MTNSFLLNLKIFFVTINKISKIKFYLLSLLVFLASIIEFLLIGLIPLILNYILEGTSFKKIKYLSYFELDNLEINTLIFYFFLFIIISMIFRILVIKQSEKFSASVSSNISTKIFHNNLNLSYEELTEQSPNAIASAITEKMTIYTSLISQFLNLFSSIVLTLGIIIYLFTFNFFLTSILLIFVLIIFFFIKKISTYQLDKNGHVASVLSEVRFKIISESFQGIRDIIISSSQNYVSDIFNNSDKKFRLALHRLNFYQNSPKILIEGIGIIILFSSVLALSGVKEYQINNYVIVNLAVFAFGAQRLFPLVNIFYNSWAAFKSYIYIVKDIHNYLKDDDNNEKKFLKEENLSINNSIVLDNVTFSYKNSKKKIFNNFSIEIPFGSSLAIIGKTGSGKSTLVDLILGLLRPKSGKVKINCSILEDKTIRSWHYNISHIPQTPFLFDDTILNNIIFPNIDAKIDYEKLKNACQIAECLDFINSLDKKFDYRIGERGINLSGGQRQRLNIARAIYQEKKILFLDEATNALDLQTELKVLSNIKKIEPKKTIIIVTHRTEMLSNIDNILDLSNY